MKVTINVSYLVSIIDSSYTNLVRAAPVWRPPVQRPRVLSLCPLKKAPPLAS